MKQKQILWLMLWSPLSLLRIPKDWNNNTASMMDATGAGTKEKEISCMR